MMGPASVSTGYYLHSMRVKRLTLENGETVNQKAQTSKAKRATQSVLAGAPEKKCRYTREQGRRQELKAADSLLHSRKSRRRQISIDGQDLLLGNGVDGVAPDRRS